MTDELDENSDSLEFLLQRHRKEAKDLQANIQSMKHSVPKGDKKRKKEITLEIARLEEELSDRHKKENEECKRKLETDGNNDEHVLSKDLEATSITDSDTPQPKISKAQKRRDKKAAKEKEREQRIAEAELESVNSARNIEAEKLKEILAAMDLAVKEINPDGHCLYNAIADQLSRKNQLIGMETLRRMTADFMLANQDRFLPFLVHSNTGEHYTSEQFVHYCEQIANTAAWGGHLEIQALAEALKMPIEIYQADSPVLRVGEEYDAPSILLSYHRHAYGLGEHYNSVIPS